MYISFSSRVHFSSHYSILIFIVRVTSGFLQENPYIYEVQLTFLTRHNLPSLDWPVIKAWNGGWERTLELVTMTAEQRKRIAQQQ